jgi:hypothetical protein
VRDVYRACYGEKISTVKAVKIALNEPEARELARCTIFKLKQPRRWLISLCKIGHIKNGCLTQKQINKLYEK